MNNVIWDLLLAQIVFWGAGKLSIDYFQVKQIPQEKLVEKSPSGTVRA